ncbi:MAG: hypothetical protein AAF590_03945 [Pseudomonadota bacterium]
MTNTDTKAPRTKLRVKTVLAGLLVLGTVAGSAGVANAGHFSFSWSTPQGVYTIGPSGSHHQPNLHAPRHVAPAHRQLRPRQARRILRQAGFRDISYLRERRNVYVFEARGQRGYRRIAVNKFDGNIIWRWGRG